MATRNPTDIKIVDVTRLVVTRDLVDPLPNDQEGTTEPTTDDSCQACSTSTQKAALNAGPHQEQQGTIAESETAWFRDSGLGRGVDMSDSKPWNNRSQKSIVEVRRVRYGDLGGTEGSNLFHSFEDTVESVESFQASVCAKIPFNKIVTVGIDSELRRSYTVTQKSVVKKVHTRTVSFRNDFDKACGQNDGDSFESRLYRYLVMRREEKQKERLFQAIEDTDSEIDMREVKIIVRSEGDVQESKEITLSAQECHDLCYDFVSLNSVTHYVHSLELGASSSREMSQKDSSAEYRAKSQLEVIQKAGAGIEGAFAKKKSERRSNWRDIGHIREGSDGKVEVQRGTTDEAVIGVELYPISKLVSNVELRLLLNNVLEAYIQEKSDVKFGPFYIASRDCKFYLTVHSDRNYEIGTTTDISNAEKFFIIRCSEGDSHFYVTNENLVARDEKLTKYVKLEHNQQILKRYLCAKVGWLGNSKTQKPRMEKIGESTNSQFAITKRKGSSPAELNEWVNGTEPFFIICREHTRKKPFSSYLCAYKDGRVDCKHNLKSDDENEITLFKLLKARKVASKGRDILVGPILITNKTTDSEHDTLYLEVKNYKRAEGTYDAYEVHYTSQRKRATKFYLIQAVRKYYFRIICQEENLSEEWLFLCANRKNHCDVHTEHTGCHYFLSFYDQTCKPIEDLMKAIEQCQEMRISYSQMAAPVENRKYLCMPPPNEDFIIYWTQPAQHITEKNRMMFRLEVFFTPSNADPAASSTPVPADAGQVASKPTT